MSKHANWANVNLKTNFNEFSESIGNYFSKWKNANKIR